MTYSKAWVAMIYELYKEDKMKEKTPKTTTSDAALAIGKELWVKNLKEMGMKERTIGDLMAAGKTTADLTQPWTYWGFKEGCPVSGDTKVDAIFNDGTDVKDTLAASLNWTHVIDYRKHVPPKIDVEGWIRWEGAAHSPVPPRTVVETVGLNGDYKGPAGMIVNWQKIKKYRVLSDPYNSDTPIKITDQNYWYYENSASKELHESKVEKVNDVAAQLTADWRERMEQKANKQPKANDIQEGGTHYKDMGVQPWDIVDTWPIEQQIGVYRHGVLKYVMRMGSKDEDVQELKKARHYISKLIEVLEK